MDKSTIGQVYSLLVQNLNNLHETIGLKLIDKNKIVDKKILENEYEYFYLG